GLYGTSGEDHADNLLRFAAFVRAALLAVQRLELEPDVVHCHDWQTALAPVWLSAEDVATAGSTRGPAPPTVLTIHNLAYQGRFPATDRLHADVEPGAGRRLPGAGDLVLLREGLRAADRVTTVSPTYATEILRPEFGFGLHEDLRALEPPVVGILNGIDTETWSPADDPHLPAGWTADDPSGKGKARAALAAEFGFDAPEGAPVFGLVSRLVDQKGIGLIEALRDDIAGWTDARFAFLGTGEPRYERLLRELDGALPHVGSRVAFDERLAHLVEGGADFFLMPSAFEPCGLNQMISHRYGTLPIVHRTGGLADSVVPLNESNLAEGTADGIVFEHFDPAGLRWAIEEARRLYADRPTCDRVRRNAMRVDHSWEGRLPAYERLYRELAVPARSSGSA
ncbi:MAG: glycogen synthase, partial [Gemmatimonadota bacterium]